MRLPESMSPPRNAKHEPTAQQLTELAGRLVAEQTTMTLATARNDVAWAAPVYYVFFKSGFYFLSDPQSRHIQEAHQSGQTSAAIHAFASTWREIRGVQMSGRIEAVESSLEALQVFKEYLKKYPFTKEFFSKDVSLNLQSFGERFGVKLYKFVPGLIYYLDNHIRFAFREVVKL
jgi:uncharacterized protein YhbP (UPF0306 family)